MIKEHFEIEQLSSTPFFVFTNNFDIQSEKNFILDKERFKYSKMYTQIINFLKIGEKDYELLEILA